MLLLVYSFSVISRNAIIPLWPRSVFSEHLLNFIACRHFAEIKVLKMADSETGDIKCDNMLLLFFV